MPLSTLIVLAVLFALFGGFIVVVGGTSLWVALGERKAVPAAKPVFPAHTARQTA